MQLSELRERMSAVVVTNVTPFAADGSVDYDAAARQAEWMVDRGIKIVVPCGNTGEYTSLSSEEAKEVTTRVARAVGDRAVVLMGVGWSSPNAIELTRHAESVGAHGVMVHHPVHTYIDRDGVRRYYERIVDAATNIGVVLYKRGPELSDAVIAELVQSERVVAVKYAVNDVNAFTNLIDSCDADVTWLCGTAERWAPFFALGGSRGFTSGLANFAPEKALNLFDALESGDFRGAMKLRRELVELEELRQLRFNGNNVPVVKEGMRLLGLDSGVVRDPLQELSADDKAAVARMVSAWGLEG